MWQLRELENWGQRFQVSHCADRATCLLRAGHAGAWPEGQVIAVPGTLFADLVLQPKSCQHLCS